MTRAYDRDAICCADALAMARDLLREPLALAAARGWAELADHLTRAGVELDAARTAIRELARI